MQEEKMEKYSALGGVLFVVLGILASIVAGAPPSSDDAASKYVEWFTDSKDGIVASGWLNGLSAVFMLWFLATLWKRLSAAPDGGRLSVLSVIGLVMGGSLFLVSTAVTTVTAHRIADVGEGSQFFYFFSAALMAASGFAIAVHLVATNALATRAKMIPQWMGGIGLLAGLGFLVAAIAGTASDSDAAFFIGFASFIVWSVWLLLASWMIWNDKFRPAT